MRRFWIVLRRSFLLIALGIAALICGVLVDHFLPTNVVAPGGPYGVGRTTLRFISAGDQQAPHPHEIFAWIWYPAATGTGTVADYLPEPWRNALEQREGAIRFVFERDLHRVRSRSLDGVGLRPADAPYPVVLFRGGLSTLSPQYTSLVEDWASRGYVVVGIDAPTRSLVFVTNDGHVINRSEDNNPETSEPMHAFHDMLPRLTREWASDASTVLDRLVTLRDDPRDRFWFGRIDVDHVAMVGHSLGGAVALQFCRQDRRCAVAIDVDGLLSPDVARLGVTVPSLLLMGGHPASEQDDPVNRLIVEDFASVFQHSTPGLLTRDELPDANHFNFSDGAVTKNHVLMALLRAIGIVRMSPREQIGITATKCATFLAHNLGKPHDLPRLPGALIELERSSVSAKRTLP